MPKPKSPRHGSMQFWPRKRASRPYARIRATAVDKALTVFAGYKMGMTHARVFDTYKNSQTKNESISIPVTILECPSMRVYSVRGYNRDAYGHQVAKDVIVGKDKHLTRKANFKPGDAAQLDSLASCFSIAIVLHTQPGKTGIGQKTPQIFEVPLNGTAAEQLETAKALVGKEIKASELFKEGDFLDVKAVTTGRGYQGPVKRFGIGLKPHKSEKGRRRPGAIAGGWSAQQHTMYRVAKAGQMGYHRRTQYNNQLLKITSTPADIQVVGGFTHYGTGREGNEFLVVKGSVPGPKKRMVTLMKAIRLKKHTSVPTVEAISLESLQGK